VFAFDLIWKIRRFRFPDLLRIKAGEIGRRNPAQRSRGDKSDKKEAGRIEQRPLAISNYGVIVVADGNIGYGPSFWNPMSSS